ncbi:hypothetical protein C8R47DRAFT_1125995 [Mycena vitilis]|nr:hypothetical protein C8R47DRAFT_1125995 [Mycena vitilis]
MSSSSSSSHSRFASTSSSSSSRSSLSDSLPPSLHLPNSSVDDRHAYFNQQSSSLPQSLDFSQDFSRGSMGYSNDDSITRYGSRQYMQQNGQRSSEHVQQQQPQYGDHSQEVRHLREQNLILQTRNDILQQSYNSLLAHLPGFSSPVTPSASSPSFPQIRVLDETDYPLAKYWQKSRWTDAMSKDRGRSTASGRSPPSKNSLLFITTEDGDPPSKDRMSEARRCAASFYFELKSQDLQPTTWREATMSTKTRFRALLESEIPELRLCSEHWKADKLATITYSSWCGSHNSTKIKKEAVSDDDDDDDSDVSSPDNNRKRHKYSKAPNNPPAKKSKAEQADKPQQTNKSTGKATEKPQAKARRVKNPLLGQTPHAPAPTPASHVDNLSGAQGNGPPHTHTSVATSPVVSDNNPLSPDAPESHAQSNNADAPSPLLDSMAFPPPALATITNISGSSSVAPTPFAIPLPLSTSSASVSAASFVSDPPILAPPVTAPVLVLPITSPLVPPQTAVNASVSGPTPAAPAPKPKTRAWNPSSTSTTASGMCAYAYKKENPAADKAAFDLYYAGLPTQKKKEWKQKEIQIKAAKQVASS